MGLKKWDAIRNKITDSMVNDVKDLRNDEFKSQMNKEKQKSDNQQLWDQYKRTGEKIDVPEFDAQITNLPEEDENEKEIKVTPTQPTGVSSYLPKQESEEWGLENLAGNGLSQPEPKEPTGTSTYLPNRQDEEMELENLAGNGIEPPPAPKEPSGISSTLPKETNEEWDLEDNAGNGQRVPLDSNPFSETIAEEPVEEPVEEPDVIPEPDEAEEEGNSVSDEEVEDTPAPNEEEPKEETKEVEDTKAPKEEGSTETKEKEEDEESPEKEKEKTTTKEGPVNDDSDLVKRGSGVSVNDIVDRSAIPHYDYLSFFR